MADPAFKATLVTEIGYDQEEWTCEYRAVSPAFLEAVGGEAQDIGKRTVLRLAGRRYDAPLIPLTPTLGAATVTAVGGEGLSWLPFPCTATPHRR